MYDIVLNELLIVLALAHTCTKMVLISDYGTVIKYSIPSVIFAKFGCSTN